MCMLDWAAEGQELLGLVLGWVGGMLHRTHTMHHGFGRAALPGPACGAMLDELCVVVIVSCMEIEWNCLSVVCICQITLTTRC